MKNLKFCYLKKLPENLNSIRRSLHKRGTQWSLDRPVRYYLFDDTLAIEKDISHVIKFIEGVCQLRFERVFDREDSDIRISHILGNGSWSYLGNEALFIPKSEPTMNIGWRDPEGNRSTIFHELFGHALGGRHEHQHPDRTLTFNIDAIVQDLQWPRSEVIRQIVEEADHESHDVGEYRLTSILHYYMPKHWYNEDFEIPINLIPDTEDIKMVQRQYGEPQPLKCGTKDVLRSIFDSKRRLKMLKISQLKLVIFQMTGEDFKAKYKRDFLGKSYSIFNL